MPRNAMPRASARSFALEGNPRACALGRGSEGQVARAQGLIIQMSPSVAVIVGYTRDRLPHAGHSGAGASFLIMTRPPPPSLTGLS
jgi:hypothetical protein